MSFRAAPRMNRAKEYYVLTNKSINQSSCVKNAFLFYLLSFMQFMIIFIAKVLMHLDRGFES